jgi:hypothetical protein
LTKKERKVLKMNKEVKNKPPKKKKNKSKINFLEDLVVIFSGQEN